MKRLGIFFLTVVCLFALMLSLTNSDPDKKWSFRSYVEYVNENIEPFPTVTLSLSFDESSTGLERVVDFFEWLFALISYPIEVVATIFRNTLVVLDGFFPVNWESTHIPGYSGGGDSFGDFGGGGFGGGGGGAR